MKYQEGKRESNEAAKTAMATANRCHGLSVYPVCVYTGQSSHSERASAEWQSSAVTPQFDPSFSFVSRFAKHLIAFIDIES